MPMCQKKKTCTDLVGHVLPSILFLLRNRLVVLKGLVAEHEHAGHEASEMLLVVTARAMDHCGAGCDIGDELLGRLPHGEAPLLEHITILVSLAAKEVSLQQIFVVRIPLGAERETIAVRVNVLIAKRLMGIINIHVVRKKALVLLRIHEAAHGAVRHLCIFTVASMIR